MADIPKQVQISDIWIKFCLNCIPLTFATLILLFHSSISAHSSLLWEEDFGGELGEGAFAVTALPGGQSAIAGYTRSYRNGNSDILVAKLSRTGKKIWERVLGGSGWESATAIKPAKDGGLFISALIRKPGIKTSDAWILKLDASGNLLWEVILGGKGEEIPYSLAILPQGDVIVAGMKTTSPKTPSKGWIARISKTGKPLWEKTFGQTKSSWFRSVNISPNGQLIAGGSAEYTHKLSVSENVLKQNFPGKSKLKRRAAWVICLSPQGKLVWSKLFKSGTKNAVQTIANHGKGKFVIAGWSRTTYGKDIWVALVKNNGKLVWQKLYGGHGDDKPGSVVTLKNGQIIMTAMTRKSLAVVTTQQAYIFGLDKKGVILWEKTYGKGRSDEVHGIAKLDRKTLAVAGTTWRPGKATQAWAFALPLLTPQKQAQKRSKQ